MRTVATHGGVLTPYNVALGGRVHALMDAQGLRKEAVAAAVGVSWLTIYKIQRGQGCRSETLPRLADFFAVSLDYLFGRTDDPTPPPPCVPADAVPAPTHPPRRKAAR